MSNMTDLWLSGVFFPKLVFGRGSAPDPAGGAYATPPDPIVGWGGGHPLGASVVRHPNTNFWLRLCIFPGTFFGPSPPLVMSDALGPLCQEEEESSLHFLGKHTGVDTRWTSLKTSSLQVLSAARTKIVSTGVGDNLRKTKDTW